MAYIWLNRKAQNQTAAIVAGYHRFDGVGFLGYTTGTEPTHQNYLRQVLSKGELHRVRSVYFEGFNVPESDYEFFAGGDNNETNTMFDRDAKHPGYALINVKATAGLGTVIKPNVDVELAVVFAEGELFPDFDSVGNQIDENGNIVSGINDPLNEDFFSYTVSPARVRTGWLLKYASNVYSRHSWNWQKWTEYRDFCNALETVDYRVIPNLEGFGLTVRFFSDTSFTTEVADSKRIDPYINFESSSGAPSLGISPTAFSAEYSGFVKQKFTEEFTLTVQRSDTAQVYIDDVLVIDVGATTGTVNLNANQFHKIKVNWVNSGGDSELILKWQSASMPLQIIKTEHYFPRVEQKAKYEAHVAIISPASPAFTEPLFNRISNATSQKVDGKIVYECFEQKQIGFNILESDIKNKDKEGLQISWQRTDADIQARQSFDVYEAYANDLDNRYLLPFDVPVSFYRDPNNIPENPKTNTIVFSEGNLYSVNMTRWQTFKILKFLMAREVTKDLRIGDLLTEARTVFLQAGDVTTISVESAGLDNTPVLITETEDGEPESTDDRRLTIQEWFDPSEFQQAMELDS